MSKLSFTKYEAAGNDFILIDDRTQVFCTDGTSIRQLCHRKFGIGADGIILLQLSDRADFRMRIFNSDGSEPEGCGNGLRCFVRFLLDLHIHKNTYRIAMGRQVVEARCQGEQILAQIQPAQDLKSMQVGPWPLHYVNTGVPHAVVFVPDVEKIDLLNEAPLLRKSLDANVNFASLLSDRSIRVRTFERGVEGETLSCGTGGAAVSVIAQRIYGMTNPITTSFKGGEIEVIVEPSHIQLAGKASKIFTGFIN